MSAISYFRNQSAIGLEYTREKNAIPQLLARQPVRKMRSQVTNKLRIEHTDWAATYILAKDPEKSNANKITSDPLPISKSQVNQPVPLVQSWSVEDFGPYGKMPHNDRIVEKIDQYQSTAVVAKKCASLLVSGAILYCCGTKYTIFHALDRERLVMESIENIDLSVLGAIALGVGAAIRRCLVYAHGLVLFDAIIGSICGRRNKVKTTSEKAQCDLAISHKIIDSSCEKENKEVTTSKESQHKKYVRTGPLSRIVITIPVLEELLYRGVLQTGLSMLFPSDPRISLILSSALFAAAHASNSQDLTSSIRQVAGLALLPAASILHATTSHNLVASTSWHIVTNAMARFKATISE